MSARLAAVVLAAWLAGCGAGQPEAESSSPASNSGAVDSGGSRSELLNTVWRITMLDTVPIPADTGRRSPHLRFTESAAGITYSSTVGCNGVGGDATINGHRITFTLGMSTQMWCGEELNDREMLLQAALSGTRVWSITGDTLELREDAGARLARFVRSAA